MRYTRKQIERQIELLAPLLIECHVIPRGSVVIYEPGSKLNGIQHGVYYGTDKYSGYSVIPGISGRLGFTSEHAFDILYAARDLLSAVVAANDAREARVCPYCQIYVPIDDADHIESHNEPKDR